MAFWMLPAAMAGINAIKGSQQRDAARDYNKHQAEVTRYSPWTGMTGQTKQVTGGLLTDAAGGAMQGAMMGQAFGVAVFLTQRCWCTGGCGRPFLGIFGPRQSRQARTFVHWGRSCRKSRERPKTKYRIPVDCGSHSAQNRSRGPQAWGRPRVL